MRAAAFKHWVIRRGGYERATAAINARIREIETEEGIPPERSRHDLHPSTVRRWIERGSRPRNPLVKRAICEVTGESLERLGLGRGVEDDGREEFLTRGADVFGASALGGPLLSLIGDLGAPPDPDPVEYERRAAELWHGYLTSQPICLAHEADDHRAYGQRLLARSRDPGYQRIADALGQTMILVGRVAFFDLGRPDKAKYLWDVANYYLSCSTDHPLLACLHGHMAFVPGWAGRWQEADSKLHKAAGHARLGGGPGLRSWVHAVAAECLARDGQTQEALRRIDKARRTLDAGGAYDDPSWLNYYDLDRLDGFHAAVALAHARGVLRGSPSRHAARYEKERVERALGHLHMSSAQPTNPQDCVTLLDRATAYALLEDDEQALVLAKSACQALTTRRYHAAAARLDTLKDLLPARRVGQLLDIEKAYLDAA